MSVRYHVQFLDRSVNVVSEMHSFALSVVYVIELLMAIEWPLVAVGVRILDEDGHAVQFLWSNAAESAWARHWRGGISQPRFGPKANLVWKPDGDPLTPTRPGLDGVKKPSGGAERIHHIGAYAIRNLIKLLGPCVRAS